MVAPRSSRVAAAFYRSPGFPSPGRLSQRLYERVVVGVGSDPKPRDGVIVDQAKGSPTDADSNRPHAGRTDLLESKARMPGIIEPESIVLAGCLPDGVGETFQAGKKVILQLRFQRSSIRISRVWPERILARILSASCSISGWDAANATSQRVSSAISSRMRAAIVSCSAGLHFRSWSIARSSSVVTDRVPARSPAMEPHTRILASETTQQEPGEIRRSCIPFFRAPDTKRATAPPQGSPRRVTRAGRSVGFVAPTPTTPQKCRRGRQPRGCRPRSGACVTCSCQRGFRSRGRVSLGQASFAVRLTQIWWLSPFSLHRIE